MSYSFAVATGATVASSLSKVVVSSSFTMVAGVTVAPSLFNVVAGENAALDAGANAFSFPSLSLILLFSLCTFWD